MYKKRYTLVNTRYGFKMYIDGYDKYISYLIHKDGVWEQKIVYILGKLMKPGFKILNLGAQSGI
jgi:hypothetical protein